MSLSELMGHMDLSLWPQMALVLFLAAFGGVLARLYCRGGARAEAERQSQIPLSDEPIDRRTA